MRGCSLTVANGRRMIVQVVDRGRGRALTSGWARVVQMNWFAPPWPSCHILDFFKAESDFFKLCVLNNIKTPGVLAIAWAASGGRYSTAICRGRWPSSDWQVEKFAIVIAPSLTDGE
jgi:hypothetical protein